MSWYRSGTVTVTNGSFTVTGAGTDFVANAQIGHAFRGPDGRTYEIGAIVSATEMTLAEPYLSASGGGQAYAIQPTSSLTRDLALNAAQLLNTFAVVRDTIGQGLFPDGTVAAPGVRFAEDQDTGYRRLGANAVSLVTGGADRVVVTATGLGVGTTAPQSALHVARAAGGALTIFQQWTDASDQDRGGYVKIGGAVQIGTNSGVVPLSLAIDYIERARIDTGGNLLVGVQSGAQHIIAKQVGQGSLVLNVLSAAAGAAPTAVFAGVNSYTPNGSGAALYLGRSDTTGRSLNAGGTLNASGADYAEYMTKAAGCGTIAKGDVCGVDSDGRLTKMWADAHSFVIKSSDPSYVGGDTWGLSVGPRPEGPGEAPSAPHTPPSAPTSEQEADVAAWRAIVEAYPVQLAAYQSAHDAWATAKAAHDATLAAWEAALEAARQTVDRIAFSGQVPVNVTGDFAVGDYLIAVASGAGIKAIAVPADTITFDQYRRRLGKVWAVRDGRAWVDVQHG